MISIENCNKLKTENLIGFKNRVFNNEIIQEDYNNKKLLGLYISVNGDNEKSRYVFGTLNNFMAYLTTNATAKPLCDGYEYIGESFPYGAPNNELIYKYIHKEIQGDVIIFKKDKSNIDKNIHNNLSNISGKNLKDMLRCYYCCHLLSDNDIKRFKTEYPKICYFL